MNPFAHVEKRLLDPARVRTIRDGFSWIDRRFVRDGLVERGLIAFETPLYQVLELPAHARGVTARPGGLSCIGDVLRELAHDRSRAKS